MKRLAATALVFLIFLTACGNVDETHVPERYFAESTESSEPEPAAVRTPRVSSDKSSFSSAEAPVISKENSAPAEPVEIIYSYTAENVPEIIPSLIAESDKSTLELANVYSEGKLFTLTASVGESAGREFLTLILSQDGERRDTFGLAIPEGDRFVFIENAEDNSTYGFEALSNLREFDAPEYPDIIGFIFREENGEAAVPIYARYFAVFGGRLRELPVYENDKTAPPRGAKLEPKSPGKAVQHLTVLRSGGEGYEIIKFEYYFDLENRRLDKKQVKFYGWENSIENV
ncbi:MAG: hypothetical protein K2J77_00360 [Oscillospiraceae bacterium]|nr:hypothetical protein [Oscillospiraceae bacterium]